MTEPDWLAIGRCARASCAQAQARLMHLPPDVTLDRFIDAAAAAGPLGNYKHFSAAARAMVGAIHGRCDAATVRAFLRAALARTISNNVQQGNYQRLPPLCATYHATQVARIANDAQLTASWLDLDSDLFQKEFGIASLRLYVAGSNLVDRRCGIPRSIILRGGLRRMPRNLRAMLRLGGFKPYLQGHIHAFMLDALNPRGREDFYRCCVELFALHPHVLGMFCSSWYYDPALDAISPRLSYLRAVPVAGGAYMMHVAAGGEAIANATAKSPTRQRLYAEHKYVPRTYMFVWGKNDMQRWARTHPRAGT